MKKILSTIIALSILLTPFSSFGVNIPGYEGGIQNENSYKEVVFITGEPIVLEGSLTIRESGRGNNLTERYTYKLSNPQKNAKLDRTISLKVEENPSGDQIISTKTLDSFKETLTINGKKYIVGKDDYIWNQSTIDQQTPLLNYYAGDIMGRKTYKSDTETIVLDIEGDLVGYNSPWSATETQSIKYSIDSINNTNKNRNWQGTANVETSYNKTKDYSYSENTPTQISFRQGVTTTEKHENVLKYNYDLPRTGGKGRNIGENSTSLGTVPIVNRLKIPAARDIRGHALEEEMFLVASMEGLPANSENIGPDTFISRGDFAKIIVKSMDIPVEKLEEPKKTRGKKKPAPIPTTFKDVKTNHRNFDYIETVAKRGIMVGVNKYNFKPDAPLTRAEAYTTIIRLLGIKSNLAPINQNYSTGFKDDRQIPVWAKDHVYVARQRGMARGDYFYPNKEITKAESAKLIVDLIHYMQEDLKRDYRENILN